MVSTIECGYVCAGSNPVIPPNIRRINKMKTEKVLNSFIKYCKKHPEERFWQALRNWSKFGFILGCNNLDGGDTEDTFYF